MKSSEVLKAALALLGPNGENWCKEAFARNERQHPVMVESPTACKFCAMSACEKIAGNTFQDLFLYDAANIMGYEDIAKLNDTEPFAAVVQAFELAIDLAESAGD